LSLVAPDRPARQGGRTFNKLFQIRPEIGYYRDWTGPAFDSGNARGMWQYGADATIRF
jgi:hypothetical protein